MKNKMNAMTFAEILLVVGIIGTIAMLSLPGLKKHSQKTEMGRLAQKAYLLINEAVDNAILEHGAIIRWDFSDDKNFCAKYIAPNLKLTTNNCSTTSSMELTNGMKISIAECNGRKCHAHIDVNGNNKLPNRYGKDIFEYQFAKERMATTSGWQEAGSVEPFCRTERYLLRHDWKFSDELWNCNIEHCDTFCGLDD